SKPVSKTSNYLVITRYRQYQLERPRFSVSQRIRGLRTVSTQCALGRTRTCNLLIRSQVLYPLSYERIANRRESLACAYRALQNGQQRAEAPGFEPGMGFRPKPH